MASAGTGLTPAACAPPPPLPPLWVVKLGGSLAAGGGLRGWLDALCGARAKRIVIVPGGGPFAAAVRSLQEPCGFDADAGHGLAVRAMDLYGRLLRAVDARLTPAGDVAAMEGALRRRLTPLWVASSPMLAEEGREIPLHWEVTSDSLAAWLARKLDASALLLVKSRPPQGRALRLAALQEEGLIDKGFGLFATRGGGGFAVHCLSPGDEAGLRVALGDACAAPPGFRVDCRSASPFSPGLCLSSPAVGDGEL